MLSHLFKRYGLTSNRRARCPEKAPRRLRLEQLEDRVVPTLVSTNITLPNFATNAGSVQGVGLTSSPIAGLSYTTTTGTTQGSAVYATGASCWLNTARSPTP